MAQAPANPWPLGRYRLTEKAYMPRAPGVFAEILPPGTEVVVACRPGPHMEPLDDAAKKAVEQAGPMPSMHPARLLPLFGPDAAAAEKGTSGQILPPPPPPLIPRGSGRRPAVAEAALADGGLV